MGALAHRPTEQNLVYQPFSSDDHHIICRLPELIKESVFNIFGFAYRHKIRYLGDVDDIPAKKLCGITSVISFTGDQIGLITLHFPKNSAIDIVRKFTGLSLPYDSDDMSDFIGELANLIIGDFVALLEERDTFVSMGLPWVIRGQDLDILKTSAAVKPMKFAISENEFFIKIQARSKPRNGRKGPDLLQSSTTLN